MDLTKYGINRDNIKDIIVKYLEEKKLGELWDMENIHLNYPEQALTEDV
jgi:hypothetical protein